MEFRYPVRILEGIGDEDTKETGLKAPFNVVYCTIHLTASI